MTWASFNQPGEAVHVQWRRGSALLGRLTIEGEREAYLHLGRLVLAVERNPANTKFRVMLRRDRYFSIRVVV